jgi:hypothetical protein
MSIYQETAKVSIRTTLNLQKAADKMTQNLIEASFLSKDATSNAMKEYVNNFYSTRQEILTKMGEAAEKMITDYPFKKEVEEFNARTTENTKKVAEMFAIPVINNAKK